MSEELRTIETPESGLVTPVDRPSLRSINRIDELYSPEYFGGLSNLAAAASKSRLFGDSTPDQLFMILMTGREMGLPPTVALRNIGSFKGKTVISSQLQLAKVKEAGYIVEILENTAERATVSVKKPGQPGYSKTFTWGDAVLAGLPERNSVYKASPSTMLLNRAIGLACRYGAPEVLNGLHNADELIEIEDVVAIPPSTHSKPTVEGHQPPPPVQGWTIEAQEAFAEGMDELYIVLKQAGKSDIYEDEAAKWRKRMATDAAEKVLPNLESFVKKLQDAAAKKALVEAS